MRVCHTVASLDPRHGGPSRSIPQLVEALRAVGVQAVAHAWDAPPAAAPAPALLHDHGIWLPCNHRAAVLTRQRRIPRVVSTRGMLDPRALLHHRGRKWLAWRLYQRADLGAAALLHATSEAEAEHVRRAGLRNPVAIIPNGVEVPGPPAADAPPSPRRALVLSRIHPIKGLPLLLRAWARVRPAGWELAIAGPDEGAHGAELEAIAREGGIAGEVRFLGPVTDAEKWALLRGSELLVLPTRSESFGLAVAEALAAGVPVITTRAAPWGELPTHGCGWWVDPSADAISEALREAVALPSGALRAMGRRGRALVAHRYAWPQVAERVREVYAWILTGGPRPGSVHLA